MGQGTTKRAVLVALLCGASWPAAAQVAPVAPSASADSEAVITVTGSRIQRRDADSVGALTTLTQDDLKLAAPTSVGDLLQAMPNVGVSLNSNGTQGTSFGVSSINLRYLGSAEGSGNRTLVLVDGHRWVNAVGGRGFRDFVDLNTIPLGIVDRIEVLKDGASAIYGADAIAGVVNIQTRKRQRGFDANVRVGVTDRGDNQNYSGFLNYGTTLGDIELLASVSYSRTKPVRTDARALTTRALTPLTAPPTSPRGLFVLPGLSSNAYFGTPANFAANAANAITRLPDVTTIGAGALADNSFRVATLADDDYNTQAQGIYSIGPSERFGAFARLTAPIGASSLRIEALYNQRFSDQLFSPALLDIRGSNGFSISRDQAFNPFGTANGVPLANALAFSGNTFRIQRVATEVGNRNNRQRVDTYRVAAALEGALPIGQDWKYEVFASYARNDATFDALNQVNLDNIYRALLSPAACAAAAGCVPLNLFGIPTPEQAAYIRYNGHDEQTAQQWNAAINVSGSLFDLPGGPLGIAAGYEFRRESADDRPDAFANTLSTVLPLVSGARQLPTTAANRDPTSGAYTVHEVYAELNAPILRDVPLAQRLEFDAAVRYSRYSTVGGKATAKVGGAWEPVSGITFRSTYAQGFRAPSILELYQGARTTTFQAVDPCNGGAAAGKPGCAGVPAAYNQNLFGSGTIAGVVSGNNRLQPESADSYSAGVSLQPRFLKGFSATVDWFRIDLRDAIGSQSATQILQACAFRQIFCDLVSRAGTGEVLLLRQAVVNLSSIRVSGIDATVRYVVPTRIGRFEGAVDVAYLDTFRTTTVNPDGSITVDERAGKSDQPRSTFPRWKGQASLRYNSDAFDLGWKVRYIGPSDDIAGNSVNGGRVPPTTYLDVQLGLSIADKRFRLAFGIDNLFDKQPPASAANNPINFDIYTYDIRGRYLYVTVGAKF